VGVDEERSYKRKINIQDELLGRILDAAARTKKREDELRRTIRDFRKRVAKCIEANDGIFEHLLSNVTLYHF
jgi:hypothetical protein